MNVIYIYLSDYSRLTILSRNITAFSAQVGQALLQYILVRKKSSSVRVRPRLALYTHIKLACGQLIIY